MKTFVYIGKPPGTGARFPAFGSDSSFYTDHKKPTYFIRGRGTKPFKKKDWREEEIPDLAKPFTDAQWIAYADQYGDECAMQFFDCCDYSKPMAARQLRNPPKYETDWHDPANNQWFKTVFGAELMSFVDGFMLSIGNAYSLDVIKFENYLARYHGYPKNQDGSMAEFMEKKFGKATTERFCRLAFPFNYALENQKVNS